LDEYKTEIERIVRTQILGTIKEVGQVGLSNTNTRLFMSRIGLLIDHIYNQPGDAEVRSKWHDLVLQYNLGIELLRKRSDYTPDDIERFQDLIDEFFEKYYDITGVEGITNYIHMLASGHIKYYMEQHGNLYKFSQQGWEALNAKIKHIFFRHSQRGGNYGRHSDENERFYLFSIMKAFQREMLWISGDGENLFNPNN